MYRLRLCSRPLCRPLQRRLLSAIASTPTSPTAGNNSIAGQATDTKPYYLTTPIFYVNAEPHIGHLYTIVLSDAIRRFQQLRGRETLLATGTDEHGMKIQQAAKKAQVSPIELCDQFSERFRTLSTAAGMPVGTSENIVFTRTTDKEHQKTVVELWASVDNGNIYKGQHQGWYSVADEAFYQESQVRSVKRPSGRKVMESIETGRTVEWTVEENYKFRLSNFRQPLFRWIHDNPDVILPQVRSNEILSYLSQPLPDLSISRPKSRLSWGISVPSDNEHVIYVWLDALANYLTASRGHPNPRFQNAWPADLHVVGKDIIKFHAVYWPAFLMAAGLPLPRRILAHAHWTMGHTKMSKTRGNVADPFALLKTFGQDGARYYMLRDGGITNDSDYNENEVAKRYRKELAGLLGNLLARATTISLLPNGTLPPFPKTHIRSSDDQEFHDLLCALPDKVAKQYELGLFNKGIAFVEEMISQANRYFSDNEPWNLVKNLQRDENRQRLHIVLFYSLEALRIAGILLQPVMPERMDTLLSRLGVTSEHRQWKDAQLDETTTTPRSIVSGSPLFPQKHL